MGPVPLCPYPLPEYHKTVDFFYLGSKISVNVGRSTSLINAYPCEVGFWLQIAEAPFFKERWGFFLKD
jgi:hypothetical protein